MKLELSNVDGFRTYAYLENSNHPEGYKNFRITTQWKTAKDPEAEHTKLSILLSPDALNNLRTLIK